MKEQQETSAIAVLDAPRPTASSGSGAMMATEKLAIAGQVTNEERIRRRFWPNRNLRSDETQAFADICG